MSFFERWLSSRAQSPGRSRWRQYFIRPRFSEFDHLRPHRWNWGVLVRPLDHSLERGAQQPLPREKLVGLRFFWFDGFFSAVSENFFLTFVPLFALAYGASNSQIGILTAMANLLGAIALFPGARMVESVGQRKPIVVWSGGGIGRAALLGLACVPFAVQQPGLAIGLIIALNGLRAFMSNFGNPAWTSIVADLVPNFMRGRYFGSRNMAMGIAALVIAPVAGWIIRAGNGWLEMTYLGYQFIFFLAFAFGMVSTFSFQKIPEPVASAHTFQKHHKGDLRRAIKKNPGYLGLVISAFVWSLSLQVAAPFFNVYLVSHLHASVAVVGLLSGVTSLFMLPGQFIWGRVLDIKGAIWVARFTGLLIPVLPMTWMVINAPWQVVIVNVFSGLLWSGYNLSNFNLLLEMTPNEQRPRAVALYQTAVFTSAVVGPLLGGYLADAISFKAIFGLSGVGRLAGTLIFIWFAARPALRAARQPASPA